VNKHRQVGAALGGLQTHTCDGKLHFKLKLKVTCYHYRPQRRGQRATDKDSGDKGRSRPGRGDK